MFSVLLLFGQQIYRHAPPIPAQVVTENGEVLFTKAEIERGQNVWQALGGMQQGSIWGHGSYLAPDWSADWLHREAQALMGIRATMTTAAFAGARADALADYHAASIRVELRTNTYDDATRIITVRTPMANPNTHLAPGIWAAETGSVAM